MHQFQILTAIFGPTLYVLHFEKSSNIWQKIKIALFNLTLLNPLFGRFWVSENPISGTRSAITKVSILSVYVNLYLIYIPDSTKEEILLKQFQEFFRLKNNCCTFLLWRLQSFGLHSSILQKREKYCQVFFIS